MTIIVYRDGVLAADSLSTAGSVRCGTDRKIVRAHDGSLAAAAGTCGSCSEFLSWANARDCAFPTPDNDDDFEGILVKPDGSIVFYDFKGRAFTPPTDDYYVLGCGYEIALGALAVGATAEQAVAACIKHHALCGGPIQVESI